MERRNNEKKDRGDLTTVDEGKKICKCFYANVRSLANRIKMAELEIYVKNENPDIIGLTETWTNNKISDDELKLVGYDMFRKDRENQKNTGHGAGGVLLYVKNDLNAVQREDLNNRKFKESVWCELKLKTYKLIIGVCYRTPSSNEDADKGLCELISKANEKPVIIIGDFNYHVNWDTLEGQTHKDEQFLHFINDEFLTQLIRAPTRGRNTLDLLLTCEENS